MTHLLTVMLYSVGEGDGAELHPNENELEFELDQEFEVLDTAEIGSSDELLEEIEEERLEDEKGVCVCVCS